MCLIFFLIRPKALCGGIHYEYIILEMRYCLVLIISAMYKTINSDDSMMKSGLPVVNRLMNIDFSIIRKPFTFRLTIKTPIKVPQSQPTKGWGMGQKFIKISSN